MVTRIVHFECPKGLGISLNRDRELVLVNRFKHLAGRQRLADRYKKKVGGLGLTKRYEWVPRSKDLEHPNS